MESVRDHIHVHARKPLVSGCCRRAQQLRIESVTDPTYGHDRSRRGLERTSDTCHGRINAADIDRGVRPPQRIGDGLARQGAVGRPRHFREHAKIERAKRHISALERRTTALLVDLEGPDADDHYRRRYGPALCVDVSRRYSFVKTL